MNFFLNLHKIFLCTYTFSIDLFMVNDKNITKLTLRKHFIILVNYGYGKK